MLVSDRNTRLTSAFWTSLHEELGASLIFGLHCLAAPPRHYQPVERVYGVIAADILHRSFAGDRCYYWPDLVPLVEFTLNYLGRPRLAPAPYLWDSE